MAEIFLSYARASNRAARRIAAAFRQLGYSVWFDEQLPAHRAYADVIEEQLESAKAVVVLWSAEAASSQWVRSEANRARETGRLVQVRVEDSRLPMPFDQIQCADLRRWSGDLGAAQWQSVLDAVSELVGGKGSADDSVRPRPSPSRLDRRRLLIAGAAAAAVGAAGFAGWKSVDRPQLSPQAELLLERGLAALQDNDALDPQGPGSTVQAIALLSDATEAAPQSATAWGGLAMAYAVRKRVAPLAERPGLEMRSRSAAERALRIDPDEVRALGALRLVEPVYRNWLNAERESRASLSRNPSLPILLFVVSGILGSVGRWKDAASFSRRFDRRKFLIPGAERKLIVDLWSSGDLAAADAALKAAVDQWAQHPQLWRTRLAYLMYSGRPGEALDLLRDDADRPPDVGGDFVQFGKAIAEGLAGRRGADAALAAALDHLERTPAAALEVASAAAALGAADAAFPILDGYYFGEGRWAGVAPAGGDSDRITGPLFQPPMKRLWSDARFDRLVERIGLEDYWRQSGTQPDFRTTG